LYRVIGGLIVNGDQFKVGEGLRQHGIDSLADVFLPVKNGHQYAKSKAHSLSRID
jgi:hypothetical protein